MPSLADFQSAFNAVLHGGDISLLPGARSGGVPLDRRMDVYRNNVYASLIDALASAFPVVERLVGREFFRAMAREFLRDRMPVRQTLIGFGEGFPEFMDTFPPLEALPYLGDVGRLEFAWLSSYHAADLAPVAPDDIRDIPAEALADLRFELHPAVRIVTSRYPVFSIWQANRQESEPGQIDVSRGEAVLLLRPALAVECHSVGAGMAAFCRALESGRSLGAASDAAFAVEVNFDLGAALSLLLTGGGIGRFYPANEKD
ncbi:MAG: DNA-binding domain-containing protein [Parvibaculaceae bacterium]